MRPTTLHLNTQFTIAPVDPRIFGGFLEHMGRAVYQGVFDPDSAHADEQGFRRDVLAALRRLNMTAMRYPGGNFVSGYHWLDGVGPREQRPTVRELAWQSIEPNHVGTDEYIALCRKMGWTPMLSVNLGTGTPEEARNWVEYCNCPPGSKFADLRATNGASEPHAVKLWCLGNEMDSPWQLGHVPARDYAIRAQQAAKMMKDVDRSLELVACGSCHVGFDSYMEWDRTVLEYMADFADYISLHRYAGNRTDDSADFLAFGNAVDRQIEEIDAVCRYVQGKRKSRKRAYLCFDEWNVWYRNMQTDGAGKFAPPLIEEEYNLEDALVVSQFLHSFIRHADVVKIANLAQIVNVIAPIRTRGDELLLQSIFYPFEMFAKRRSGTALRIAVDGPGYTSASHGPVKLIDASAILGEGELHLFATNRSLNDETELRLVLAGAGITAIGSAEILTGSSAKVANSFDEPNLIATQPFTEVALRRGQVVAKMPPLSVVALTLALG